MGARIGNDDADDLEESHEINVTPFIDVVLVLLIIFMVAAPLATVDINVDLPNANARSQPRPDEPVYITLADDLSVSLGEEIVTSDDLGTRLDELTESEKETRLFVRADQSVAYGELMDLMNRLRALGYTQIGLVALEATQPGP